MKRIFVKQHDAKDCAAACLSMVCLHYKKETTITQLRDKMETDLKGTNLVGHIPQNISPTLLERIMKT